MSGINIIQKYHGSITEVANDWAEDNDTTGTIINTNGYTKLAIYYSTSTGWDRAGNIIVLGAMRQNDTYVVSDDTIENSTFGVATTDDTGFTGSGQYYVVENILPFTKIVWTNTTPGAAGTLTVLCMPFNE